MTRRRKQPKRSSWPSIQTWAYCFMAFGPNAWTPRFYGWAYAEMRDMDSLGRANTEHRKKQARLSGNRRALK